MACRKEQLKKKKNKIKLNQLPQLNLEQDALQVHIFLCSHPSDTSNPFSGTCLAAVKDRI